MGLPDITAIAEGARAALRTADIVVDGRALKVYATEPRAFDYLPAAWVSFEYFRRPGAGQRQTQLGAADWWLQYTVGLSVPCPEPDKAQRDMAAVLAATIDAFDTAGSLGLPGVVQECVLAEGQQGYTTLNEVQAIQVLSRLEVWALSIP